jgi:transposase InsO family protein
METTLQCDASELGLGATLMQNDQPIAYASRALTKTEQNYAQIEKELLAVVFGMEKFHQYTYGRKTYVHSDHKPLESLYKKPLFHAPKRLQRMFLRLQRYDIELSYKQGKHMYIADTLSRAYLKTNKDEVKTQDEILLVRSDIDVEVEQINMADYLVISEERQKLIAKATKQDKTLEQLIKVIEQGWDTSYIPNDLNPYYNVRDELSVQNGIIFKGDRCIIPSMMRNEIMSQIHTHIGIEGCLKRARECVYWPRMNSELRDYTSKCDVCQTYGLKQPKKTIKSHDVPTKPWVKIGTDLFCFSGNDYLITAVFFEIDRLYDTSSKTVISKLKQHFARWGIPETVISDNGPQYSSEQFKNFSRLWDFKHKTSSPGHAQSNGKVENTVKSAKRIMRKAKKSNSDPFIASLNFRNTVALNK